MDFQSKILVARRQKGLTQKMLAEKLALSENYICLIEKGKKTPSLKTIARIAEALGVSASSLVNEAMRKNLMASNEAVDDQVKKIMIDLDNQYGLENILRVLVKTLRENGRTNISTPRK